MISRSFFVSLFISLLTSPFGLPLTVSFLAVSPARAEVPSQPLARPLKVMIDPGHGGTDSGAVYGKAREADIVLKVALALKELMSQDPGFNTSLTRTSDRNLTLPERVADAEKQNVDLFVSIHANASRDQRARGAEFYFQNQLAADEDSMYLANLENQHETQLARETNSDDMSSHSDVAAIIDDLKHTHKMFESRELSLDLLKAWQPSYGGSGVKESTAVRQAPFYVISKTRIPSVLVELGFISNPKESEKLMRASYQREMAQKIYSGLRAYRDKVENSTLDNLR
jgi:N-acetylmuramoyl-L-alanine amidase